MVTRDKVIMRSVLDYIYSLPLTESSLTNCSFIIRFIKIYDNVSLGINIHISDKGIKILKINLKKEIKFILMYVDSSYILTYDLQGNIDTLLNRVDNYTSYINHMEEVTSKIEKIMLT